jgi:hypothetical protein
VYNAPVRFFHLNPEDFVAGSTPVTQSTGLFAQHCSDAQSQRDKRTREKK